MVDVLSDEILARELQRQFNDEAASEFDNLTSPALETKPAPQASTSYPKSLVDNKWELLDPCPDARALFLQFNDQYFWGKLSGCEVKWSPRMTLCAGVCSYEGYGGLCSIRLSVPLLKLRPRKDLVETLLHEMIHAYLFVTQNNRDRDGHGPEFQKHMQRINKETGTNITIYHDFHDEVDNYRQHWWRCDGPCQKWKPYYGFVKRAMNRAPSYRDPWWAQHKERCGGTYHKIKEPEGYGKRTGNKEKPVKVKPKHAGVDIRTLFGGKGFVLGGSKTKSEVVDNPARPSSEKDKVTRPTASCSNANCETPVNQWNGSGQDLPQKSSAFDSSMSSSLETDENDVSWCEEDLDGFDWSIFDDDLEPEPNMESSNTTDSTERRTAVISESSAKLDRDALADSSQNKRQKTSEKGYTSKGSGSAISVNTAEGSGFKSKSKLPFGKVSTAVGSTTNKKEVKSKDIGKMFQKVPSTDISPNGSKRVKHTGISDGVEQRNNVSDKSRQSFSTVRETAITDVVDLTGDTVVVSAGSSATSVGEATVLCPVCSGVVWQSKINAHLDLCL